MNYSYIGTARIKCPYCGCENSYNINRDDERRMVRYCDKERGGCARPFVVDWESSIYARALEIVEVASPLKREVDRSLMNDLNQLWDDLTKIWIEVGLIESEHDDPAGLSVSDMRRDFMAVIQGHISLERIKHEYLYRPEYDLGGEGEGDK